jgi:hypothetical protein
MSDFPKRLPMASALIWVNSNNFVIFYDRSSKRPTPLHHGEGRPPGRGEGAGEKEEFCLAIRTQPSPKSLWDETVTLLLRTGTGET